MAFHPNGVSLISKDFVALVLELYRAAIWFFSYSKMHCKKIVNFKL